jgi:hypothetical protein
MLRLRDELERSWQTVTFTIEEVSLTLRQDPPDAIFRVAHRIPLVGAR